MFFGVNGLQFRPEQAKQHAISHMGSVITQSILSCRPSGEGSGLSFPHGGLTGEQE